MAERVTSLFGGHSMNKNNRALPARQIRRQKTYRHGSRGHENHHHGSRHHENHHRGSRRRENHHHGSRHRRLRETHRPHHEQRKRSPPGIARRRTAEQLRLAPKPFAFWAELVPYLIVARTTP